jgi:hypothetical protein
LQVLEDPETHPNYATKMELQEVLSRNPAMFDGGLSEIEEQIGNVFQNIFDLTLH